MPLLTGGCFSPLKWWFHNKPGTERMALSSRHQHKEIPCATAHNTSRNSTACAYEQQVNCEGCTATWIHFYTEASKQKKVKHQKSQLGNPLLLLVILINVYAYSSRNNARRRNQISIGNVKRFCCENRSHIFLDYGYWHPSTKVFLSVNEAAACPPNTVSLDEIW